MAPSTAPHPLRSEILQLEIPLWKLSQALGHTVTESALSRQLRGIDPMRPDVEEAIRKYLAEVEAQVKAVNHG